MCFRCAHFCYYSTYGMCQITKYRLWKSKKNKIFNLSLHFLVAAHIIITSFDILAIIITSFDILAIIITSFDILAIIITSLAKGKRTKRQTTIHKTQHRKLKINQHEPHKKLLAYLDRIVFLDYVFKSFTSCAPAECVHLTSQPHSYTIILLLYIWRNGSSTNSRHTSHFHTQTY